MGDRPPFAVAYSYYASGRPRLVVSATQGEGESGEILLVRFPNAKNGKPSVLQRLKVDLRPVEVEIVRVIDAKDVLVTFFARHSPPGFLYRVIAERLVKIADTSVYWGLIPIDLDGDGVPELISTGCCERTPCGVGIGIDVEKYNGTKYKTDKRRYIEFLSERSGGTDRERNLIIPWPIHNRKLRRYKIHIFNDGADGARLRLDGKDVVPPAKLRHFTRIARTVELEFPESIESCHKFMVRAYGPQGSAIHVLVEELP